jgi:16S rRNA (guanine527-N7)-methyltransferase
VTEDEAKAALDVPRETLERLERFVALLREANGTQNLVSAASLDEVWNRHILDSAQLVRFAPSGTASWLDLGSGPGLPGLIVALLHQGPVTLIESRRLRVEFLQHAAAELGVNGRVEIIGTRLEAVPPRPFDVISARAFAPLGKLLDMATAFSTEDTRWVLPKGRNAQSELEAVRASWQGAFRLEPSVTDSDASIIVAEGVRRKGRGKSVR